MSATRVLVVGAGAVGARAARQLASADGVEVLVHDVDPHRVDVVVGSLGAPARAASGDEAVAAALLATPAATQPDLARRLLERGIPVVSTADSTDALDELLGLQGVAVAGAAALVVGAGFAPGFTCLLARHGADELDRVDEVHVSRVGAGGPACAEARRSALAGRGSDWRSGTWVRRRAGFGGELRWFPDPVGGRECHPAALVDATLLQRAFPGAQRITARLAATATERVSARLPELRRPSGEGGLGAVRVELRGERAGAQVVAVYGAIDRPAVAGGAVAAHAALRLMAGTVAPGVRGLAELGDPLPMLRALHACGIKAATFAGT